MTARATAIVVVHVEAEGPHAIGVALDRAGVEVQIVRTDLGEPVPTSVSEVDGVVVMGGPMAADNDEGFPSRRDELALLSAAVAAEVPVLGVCLGAQLLAAATGAPVRRGHGIEIGWAPVELTPAAAGDPLLAGLPSPLELLHWHRDTYDLPSGAVHLGRSAAYEQQIFRVGPAAWGFQCHVEVDSPAVAGFVSAMPTDAAEAVGGADQVLADTPAASARLRAVRSVLLERFADLVIDRRLDR